MLAGGLAAWAATRGLIAAPEAKADGIPTRPFGRHKERVSCIALGGHDIGRIQDESEAASVMHEAIEAGLTFFDNCWEYHNGRSEELMGKALEGGWRDRVFLMSKVCGRTYEDAKKGLDDSLRRLRTDRLDLWMFHGIKWNDDPDLIFHPENGAARAAIEARKAGKIRYLGFTGHKDPQHHLAMLERTKSGQPFEYDAVLMPMNILDPHYRSFQKEVLPVLNQRGIAALAIKALGSQNGRIPKETGIPAAECRRYVLSQPITSLVCGIASRENLRQDLEVARSFAPMNEAEAAKLIAGTQALGEDGHIEAYKVGDYGCNIHHRKKG
jgi:aryl-alcohol dehydrogenase-like predicted oxidoreductase